MLSRIKDDLNIFLKQHALEISSRIFEDSIPLLANLEINEPQMTCFYFATNLKGAACRFSTSYNSKNQKTCLTIKFWSATGVQNE
jgi:hypothetical protein